MEDGTDDNLQVCSFVSVQYIICECGSVFGGEQLLKDHLEKEHFGETKKIRNAVWPMPKSSEGIKNITLPSVSVPIHFDDIKIEKVDVEFNYDETEEDISNEIEIEPNNTTETEFLPENASITVQESIDIKHKFDIMKEVSNSPQKSLETKPKPVLKLSWKSLKKCDLKILPDTDFEKGKIVFENVDDEPLPEEVKMELTKYKPNETNQVSSEEFAQEEIVVLSQGHQDWVVEDNISEDNSLGYGNDTTYFINAEPGAEDVEEIHQLYQIVDEQGNVHYQRLPDSYEEEVNQLDYYQCSACTETFAELRSCRQHEAKAHKLKKNNGKPKKNNEHGNRQICDQCGKSFTSHAALGYHTRIHTGEKPYECDYCGKKFTMLLLLQVHKRIHTGEKPYPCQHCPKAFGNKAAINRHMRVHTGAKPYSCPECGKSFTQSNSMKLHVRCVHRKLPPPYKRKPRDKSKQMKVKKDVMETYINPNLDWKRSEDEM